MWGHRRMKRKAVIIVAISLLALIWVVACLLDPDVVNKIRRDYFRSSATTTRPERNMGWMSKDFYTVVHLDLKGAPPKLSYLKKLLPLIASQGSNALLVEYEDMFPYTGRLANLSAKNAYTKQEVGELLSAARELNMEVIPLVQTFGHLEFALKLEEFKSLRELPPFPQEVCPSNPGSMSLVEEMVAQVMALHPEAKYLHIGCDEVFHIAACPVCSQLRLSGRELYSNYVSKVAEMVRNKYPDVIPLIWDDMMRQWPPHFLESNPLTNLVEPMVWVYTREVGSLLPHYVWHWYLKTFPRVWVAGAFKGASYPTSVLPNAEHHYANQQSWMDYVARGESKVSGLVLTGWSRYDHFAVLCELLPVSLPSLLLGLNLVKARSLNLDDPEVFPLWRKALRCSSSSAFDVASFENNDQRQLASCDFPGSDLFNAVLYYLVLRVKVDSLDRTMTETNGWMTDYNVRHNFTSPWRLVEDFSSLKVNTLKQEVERFKTETKTKLLVYYDEDTAAEWLEQKVKPMEDKLNNLGRIVQGLITRDVWPRRPFR